MEAVAARSVQGRRRSLRLDAGAGRQLLLAVLLGLLLVCPWSRAAHAQFTRFQNFTDEQGLGNLSVGTVAQDRDGYILFGTEAGLYRYDGATIAPYGEGLPSAVWIRRVLTDDAGRVWVVATDGLYVGHGSTFSRVDVGPRPLQMKSPHLLAVDPAGVVLDAGGTLLRAPIAEGEIGRFSPLFAPATVAAAPGLAMARFVVSDGDGVLLIGCGVAICRTQGGEVAVLGEAHGLPPDAWQVALRTSDGTLWARSLDRIAWRKPGEAMFSVATLPGRSPPGAAVPGDHTSYVAYPERLDLLDDRHGGVLTQSVGGLVDWDGATWHAWAAHPNGLPYDRIEALMFDREGSLWVGGFGGGAFRSIGLGEWEHLSADDGLPSKIVWSITRLPNRQLYVATDAGTVAIGGSEAALPAETNYVAKRTRGGRLWVAPVGSPLTRYDPVRGTIERFASLGKVVTADLDRENRLWLGTSDGTFLVADADAPAADVHAEQVLEHETSLVTSDPDGVVWALSPDGVFRRDDAGRFDLVMSRAALDSNPVALASPRKGELWIGTETEGVLRFRVTGTRLERLPSIVWPQIGSNNVLFALRDHRGWIWVGTDHGIDRFDGQDWRRFDSSDGPITNDINQAAVYEDVDGSMWFGTSHGLSHLLDPTRQVPPGALHPLITGVSLGEQALPVSPSIEVDWSHKPLLIQYVDLDYTHGRNLAFRYRLRELDAGWTTTTGHEARYAGLPAGTLHFELVAVDTLHGTVSDPVKFKILIRAPWWRRGWFYGLCGFAGTALLVAAWQTRVRLLMHAQRRLEQMVTARTAEIEHARSRLEHQASDMQHQSRELERQARELERLAMSDVLTGLANRRAIMEVLDERVAAAQRSDAPLAVLLYDIDHFKKINDGFGHLAGDAVLAEFGARLAAAVAHPEAVGRYGGEEFLVLLPGGPGTVPGRVSAIQAAITKPSYFFCDAERTVTSSGGLAFLRAGDTALSLLARADTALYDAKENGRNRIEEERSGTVSRRQDDTGGAPEAGHEPALPPGSVDPMPCHDHDRDQDLRRPRAPRCPRAPELRPADRSAGELERDLVAALAGDEFTLHYQPVLDVNRGVITSCEALLRWQSPSRGFVAPIDFVPFAEKIGLMPGIGDWVLRAACREAAGWPDGLRLSVNLSPVQLRLPDLVGRTTAALEDAGLAFHRLELEVTETATIDDVAAAASVIRELRRLGITIALDDFGTGYSSLSLLRTLAFDRLKIDRSFVHDLGIDPEAAAIVRAVIGLSMDLGASVTAEGVESDEQIDLLRDEGCSEIQGFRISPPRPAPQMREWLACFVARGPGRRGRDLLNAASVGT